jgi:hypothetical protein
MASNPSDFEFHIVIDGNSRHYFVSPIYTPEGDLQQISIRPIAPDNAGGQMIKFELDPNLFKSFAMPSLETTFKIAIAQASNDGLFKTKQQQEKLILDFAVEPWSGDLIPI